MNERSQQAKQFLAELQSMYNPEKHSGSYNVVCDGGPTAGFRFLSFNVTEEMARLAVKYYTLKYEGQPYPNGKGCYPHHNFRVIKVA